MTDEPELEPPQAEDEPTQAVVYRYGTDPRTPIPPEVDEQLVLVHSLRHDLVTIEEVHEEARRELVLGGGDRDVGGLELAASLLVDFLDRDEVVA